MVSRWEDGQANKLKNECMNRRRQMDSWTEGQTDGEKDARTDGQTDGEKD